ncbi:MAG: ferrous iron transport protein A [Deltaproteobacteria bacterium]|jgi:Fe2+ transport system protein FeoA|nr:ferrous iron transport protein A [Deltaproteobacteria bacterium]
MGCKLLDFKVGKPGVVKKIKTERSLECRLCSMGLFPGAPIKLITKGPAGVLVSVGCSKISLEPNMAQCIMVA